MQRMVRYHKGITNGLIKIDAKPEIVKETPISAVIDGHDGMGQLLGHKAMEMAIEKAKKSGVGIVSVRNSNHYGIAGYYAKMASDQGLISAPAGIFFSGVISARFPSASSAHNSIPSDKTPASFAGFKFTRTITFLPTISSGV